MLLAKNNIIVKIKAVDADEYAILNPVSGSFDIMDGKEHELYERFEKGNIPEHEFSDYLLERGYAYESQETMNAAIEKAYDSFNEEVENSQIQLMLVPTYNCNLACTYCFQHGIQRGTGLSEDKAENCCSKPSLISKETVDAFFDYAASNFSGTGRKPFVTLFGGEPLINSPAQREIIEYIIDRCVKEDYELAAVTNGYDLAKFIDLLKRVRVKEIQITLDGSREVHDSRRATANNRGTFDRIISGMAAAIEAEIPINLRSVVDAENIGDLVHLAEFLDSKGWLDLPPQLFKTQLGRNYELFDCYAKPQHLMTQVELWGEFSLHSKKYPILAKFHRPDFKGVRHLVDTGELYMASFDTCPACKTEWVFDLYGHIYGCTASCGREEYLLGTYWPEVNLNDGAINTWRKRDVKSIPECQDCRYDVICGGGCGVVAANRSSGKILSGDCRPVQELLDLGINHYIKEIKEMSGDDLEQLAASSACGCGSNKTEDCMICGKTLIYKTQTGKEKCAICGRSFETFVKCMDGHYVCDSCHSSDILGKIERLLLNSTASHPVELAGSVFAIPGLNMHGPEYHSIVPAVLVAAYQNLTGKRDASKIKEAIRRGRDTKGGSCGFNGNCGAAVGAGVAVSIIEGATPLSDAKRGNAMRATGHALMEISSFGGPRCCKRESITSIKTFINTTGYFKGVSKEEYKCEQFAKNKDCIHKRCPYFPTNKQKYVVRLNSQIKNGKGNHR